MLALSFLPLMLLFHTELWTKKNCEFHSFCGQGWSDGELNLDWCMAMWTSCDDMCDHLISRNSQMRSLTFVREQTSSWLGAQDLGNMQATPICLLIIFPFPWRFWFPHIPGWFCRFWSCCCHLSLNPCHATLRWLRASWRKSQHSGQSP